MASALTSPGKRRAPYMIGLLVGLLVLGGLAAWQWLHPPADPKADAPRLLALIDGKLDGEASFMSSKPLLHGLKIYGWTTFGPLRIPVDVWVQPEHRREVFEVIFKREYPRSLENLVAGKVERLKGDSLRTWSCVRSGPLTGTVIEVVHDGYMDWVDLMSPEYVRLRFTKGVPSCS